jgi:prepilin-type N-terminal cleavage/methylation domain-containing protein
MRGRVKAPPSAIAAPRGAGFTLVELMCALAVTAILLAIGVPSLHRLITSRAVAAHVDTFTSALRFARSEAAKRGVPVSVCASLEPDRAEPACAASGAGGWQTGWLVFVDRGELGRIDEGDEVLRVEQALRASGGVQSSRRYLTFQPNGIALNATGSYLFKPGSGSSDADVASLQRTVCVNKQGRARVLPAGDCA